MDIFHFIILLFVWTTHELCLCDKLLNHVTFSSAHSLLWRLIRLFKLLFICFLLCQWRYSNIIEYKQVFFLSNKSFKLCCFLLYKLEVILDIKILKVANYYFHIEFVTKLRSFHSCPKDLFKVVSFQNKKVNYAKIEIKNSFQSPFSPLSVGLFN